MNEKEVYMYIAYTVGLRPLHIRFQIEVQLLQTLFWYKSDCGD